MSSTPAPVPIFVLFANEREGMIDLDFVLAEEARTSDGSTICAGQPFGASFTQAYPEPMSLTMQHLTRWANHSRSVQAISGIDARSRHLLVLSQGEEQVILEYC